MKKIIILLLITGALSKVNLSMAEIPDSFSPEEKIAGLSEFWKEVHYNFVYFDKVGKEKWDSAYVAFLKTVVQTENDYQYFRELQRFCALLQDGHTNIGFPEHVQQSITRYSFGEYKMIVEHVEGMAVITRVNESKKQEIPIGSVITKVNGIPTMAYIMENVYPYISSNADYIRLDIAFSQLLEAPIGTGFHLELQFPDGAFHHISLTNGASKKESWFPEFERKPVLEFEMLDDSVGYLALNSFEDGKVMDLFYDSFPKIKTSKALIIDLRSNGGGSTDYATEILQHFSNDTLFYGARVSTRMHVPFYKARGSFIRDPSDTVGDVQNKRDLEIANGIYRLSLGLNGHMVEGDIERHVVPTVVLFGHKTASAAEDFLIYADGQEHFIKMGQRSFASTGQPLYFKLMGGQARICTKEDTYADGRKFVGVGILPDMEVPITLDDVRNGTDKALEKAMEILKK